MLNNSAIPGLNPDRIVYGLVKNPGLTAKLLSCGFWSIFIDLHSTRKHLRKK